ncbi:MAG: DNA-protecting protein DprA [Phycisphaerales bacterium]|nr:DNA-protecting protein DprA [Phycisphaerales bacterium]
MGLDAYTLDLLRLTLVEGVGPVLLGRFLEQFGSPAAVLAASPTQLERVKGIGPARARAISAAVKDVGAAIDRECALIEQYSARVIALGTDEYPPALAQIPDPPPLLYLKGHIDPAGADRYGIAIVGSRECTHYGLEQAGRFGAGLASAGLTVISGGARGIDTAAHRGAITAGGRTLAILGCGLAEVYPPENASLFDRILAEDRGAIISELPMSTPPKSENFPARNRIISGLSLGVLVIEAGERSGSLITARLAAEDHGREVMALPGRVDSPTSRGTNELVKAGGAALVTEPADVIAILEPAGRRHHGGSEVSLWKQADPSAQPLAEQQSSDLGISTSAPLGLTERQQVILQAIGGNGDAATIDQLAERSSLGIPEIRADLTVLELRRQIRRAGSRFERVR